MQDSNLRSLIKTLTWRFWATPVTVMLVWIVSNDPALAFMVGLIEAVVKSLFYFLHERMWMSLSFGQPHAKPTVIWLTGLSGAGKTTIAKELMALLEARQVPVQWLDGDVTRQFLPSLGFSREARDHNVQTAGFIARTLESRGITVVASYIAPYRATRQKVRNMCQDFVEVYVATSLATCEQRDVKGLYAKARSGEIACMTGLTDPYEVPESPEVVIETAGRTPKACALTILDYLERAS